MATIDIFGDDAFSTINLTHAINTEVEGQRVPTRLDGLFEEEGVNTTAVFIEREDDSLALVPAGERGAPADVTTGAQRDAIPFKTLHLPTRSTIRADEVQGVRAFGGESELETVMGMVGKRLAKQRRRLEATIRFQRAGAITGKIYDADGQRLLLDLHSRFGIQQQSQSMALGSGATKVMQKVIDAKRKSEDVIGDSGLITGWLALCGRGFFDAFTDHDATKLAFDRFRDGQFLRDDNRAAGFQFAGVMWEEFYGKVGGVEFIGNEDAYLIPLGIGGLLVTKFAPADYMDTVNTVGKNFYASQEPLPHNKGIDLESQSNPLSLCTRPRAIIKLTKA